MKIVNCSVCNKRTIHIDILIASLKIHDIECLYYVLTPLRMVFIFQFGILLAVFIVQFCVHPTPVTNHQLLAILTNHFLSIFIHCTSTIELRHKRFTISIYTRRPNRILLRKHLAAEVKRPESQCSCVWLFSLSLYRR